ncbi:MAG: hypothetical protein C0483_18525 [Pirellula sp.]|nr:hypothetical protein [Pirellula sp.]
MKTIILFHVDHPDAITAKSVVSLMGKMIRIGMQEAHDSIEHDAEDEFEGAHDCTQLEPGEPIGVPSTPSRHDPIQHGLSCVMAVIEATYAHDENGDREEGDNPTSAADTVEQLCNIEGAVQEAIAAYQLATSLGAETGKILKSLKTAVEPVNVQLLKAMLDLLAIAEQGDPADEDERTTLEAARAAARLAKAEACEPCPLCSAAEQLCEACGGHGYVPKSVKSSIQILVHGGLVSDVYSTTPDIDVEVIDNDANEFSDEEEDRREVDRDKHPFCIK